MNQPQPTILAQVMPGATTRVNLLTVARNTWVRSTSLLCCNQQNAITTVQVSAAARGATHATSQFILYEAQIAAHGTLVVETGIYLSQTDTLRVYSTNGLVSFTLFGERIRAART